MILLLILTTQQSHYLTSLLHISVTHMETHGLKQNPFGTRKKFLFYQKIIDTPVLW